MSTTQNSILQSHIGLEHSWVFNVIPLFCELFGTLKISIIFILYQYYSVR